jgi:hypothetical protein
MRGLIRSALALFAMGAAATGCNKTASEDQKVDAPYQATFRVPGMS